MFCRYWKQTNNFDKSYTNLRIWSVNSFSLLICLRGFINCTGKKKYLVNLSDQWVQSEYGTSKRFWVNTVNKHNNLKKHREQLPIIPQPILNQRKIAAKLCPIKPNDMFPKKIQAQPGQKQPNPLRVLPIVVSLMFQPKL